MSASAVGKDKAAAWEKEAKELLKKAKHLTGPSLLELRFKPDWETAAPLLDRAGVLYKNAGNLEKSIEAFERAAMAQERMGSQWHAAKHYEMCADLAKKLEKPQDCGRFFKMAADYYMECNKPTTAGECLTRGARTLEDVDPEAAVRLYYDALDVYEMSEKDAYAVDAFRYAIAFLIKQERWADAVEVQMRFGAVSDRNNASHTRNKAYLGAVVTWLYAGDAEHAWNTFQDAMAVDGFANAEEAFVADALLEAYRSNDEGAIQRLVKTKPQFKALDRQVALLAVRLPSGAEGNVKVRRMARKLNKLMAPPEPQDEEEGEEWEEGAEGQREDELL